MEETSSNGTQTQQNRRFFFKVTRINRTSLIIWPCGIWRMEPKEMPAGRDSKAKKPAACFWTLQRHCHGGIVVRSSLCFRSRVSSSCRGGPILLQLSRCELDGQIEIRSVHLASRLGEFRPKQAPIALPGGAAHDVPKSQGCSDGLRWGIPINLEGERRCATIKRNGGLFGRRQLKVIASLPNSLAANELVSIRRIRRRYRPNQASQVSACWRMPNGTVKSFEDSAFAMLGVGIWSKTCTGPWRIMISVTWLWLEIKFHQFQTSGIFTCGKCVRASFMQSNLFLPFGVVASRSQIRVILR